MHFNPRSPCGERRFLGVDQRRDLGISIHAPRAGSDAHGSTAETSTSDFNPRSPCGERPSRRGQWLRVRYFNPRSPCGERRRPGVRMQCAVVISIHAPRAGSDQMAICRSSRESVISIHAPRAGSDQAPRRICSSWQYFNPRSPCGERRSTQKPAQNHQDISIHAPRAGSDHRRPCVALHRHEFQSTLPVRGATVRALESALYRKPISIHAPRAGSDFSFIRSDIGIVGFQSTLPVRGAT